MSKKMLRLGADGSSWCKYRKVVLSMPLYRMEIPLRNYDQKIAQILLYQVLTGRNMFPNYFIPIEKSRRGKRLDWKVLQFIDEIRTRNSSFWFRK
jgi:hypothetical protein